MIFVYISHVYDLTFFSRLFEYTNKSIGIHSEPVYLIDHRFKTNNHVINEARKTTSSTIILGQTSYKLTKLYLTIRSIRHIKNTINQYSKGNDCFFTTDKSKFIPKVLLNYFDTSILIQQKEGASENFTRERYKEAKRNLIHFLFRACTANYYKSKDAEGQIYFQKLTSCNTAIIYHSNNAKVPNRIWIQDKQNKNKQKKRILAIGSRFMEWKFCAEDGIKDKILDIYISLSRIYSDYEFIYIPHPRETGKEIAILSKIICNMTIIRSHISAESYIHSDPDFAFSISIGSTASISTYMAGIPSYVFFRSLNMPVGVAKTYEFICESLPDMAHISNPEQIRHLRSSPMKFPSTYIPNEIKKLIKSNNSIK